MASDFSAKEPALGYLHQIRYGLKLILVHPNKNASLFIEGMDDVSIETDDSLELHQTKLHVHSAANLTDASPDLWKTLRIWSEKIRSAQIIPEISLLNLVTTANASPNSICFDLKADTLDDRDEEEISQALVAVAQTSSNAENKVSYEEFLKLQPEQQKLLVQSISIADASVDLAGAKLEILHTLKFAAVKTEPLFERLEGWFLDQVITQLIGKRGGITEKEVREKVLDIADCLKVDNLPNDFNMPLTDDETQLAAYQGQTFVKQLEAIGANQKMVNCGISDYHRAFSQKSRWLRDGLIEPLDEIEYHNKLREDWERKFAIISDSPQLDGSEVQKNRGKAFYVTHYVDKCPDIHIKSRFKEQYMVTGCCHDLANSKKIGWHPDFQNLI